MTSPRDADLLDAALTRLHAFDTEYDDGMSNHGPMAAEALLNLGAPERIEPFLDGYVEVLRAPSSAVTLPDDDWQRGLGRPAAAAALVEIFDRQLQHDDPRRVLAQLVPELAPAVVSAAFHGLLRTGHAYRAWTQRDSPPRRTELAHGLAHWVSRFQQVPGQPGRRAVTGRGPAEALAAVPVLDPSERNGAGMIMDRFGVLRGRADFADAVEAFDPEAVPPHDALDELISVAARLYLGSRGRPQFVYLHGHQHRRASAAAARAPRARAAPHRRASGRRARGRPRDPRRARSATAAVRALGGRSAGRRSARHRQRRRAHHQAGRSVPPRAPP